MTNPIQIWKGYGVIVEYSRELKNIPGSARYYLIYLSYLVSKTYLILSESDIT
jgi:hypothetical protein